MDDSRSLPTSVQPNSGPRTHRPTSEDRDALLIKLLFAAKRLADSRIHSLFSGPALSTCRECGAFSNDGESAVQHAMSCRAGQVLEIIAALMAQANGAAQAAVSGLPSSEDLDTVAEEEKIAAATASCRSYKIQPTPNGNVRLILLQGNLEMGGGIFAESQYDDAVTEGDSWCQAAVCADFGEPWEIDSDDPSGLRNRRGFEVYSGVGTELLEEDEVPYAARVRECVNFCAAVPSALLADHELFAVGDVVRKFTGLRVRRTSVAAATKLYGVDALFGQAAPQVESFEYPAVQG